MPKKKNHLTTTFPVPFSIEEIELKKKVDIHEKIIEETVRLINKLNLLDDDQTKTSFETEIKKEDKKNTIKNNELTIKAFEFVKNRNFKEAAKIYKTLIQQKSNDPFVYANLAFISGIDGNKKEVVRLLRKALTLNPKYLEAHNNLGNALQSQGKLHDAIKSYKNALIIKPDFAEAHYNLGNTYQKDGDFDKAIKSYRSALEIKPKLSEAHFNLGNTFYKKGDIINSINSYNNAITIKPDSPAYHFNLGTILQENGNLGNAIYSFQEAIKLNNNFPEAYNNLGNTFLQQGENNKAIKSYRKAIEINPIYAEAYNNLGNALHLVGDLINAITACKKAIKVRTNFSEAYLNLANIYKDNNDIQNSIRFYTLALKYKPNFAEAYNNFGHIFLEKGNINVAIKYYKKAIELKDRFPEAHYNLGNSLLLIGNYKQGWEEYEYRFSKKQPSTPHAKPMIKKWDGGKLYGQSLLLVSEQGLGDTLQFMRYILYLKTNGIKVNFCAQKELHNLITVSKIDRNPLLAEQVESIHEGQWLPLLSLPKYLEINQKNALIKSPYIKTTPKLLNKWKKKLRHENMTIIGINWQGNKDTEKNNLKGRSFKLELLSPLAKINNIRLVSLQKGYGSEQLENCSFKNKFVSCQHQINNNWDFLETAAIIANCDYVITSDTSVAHLSGGMGKETWLLLHKIPDWRWGTHGERTFWYPSMKLFRQKELNKWQEVIEKVVIELKFLVNNKNE